MRRSLSLAIYLLWSRLRGWHKVGSGLVSGLPARPDGPLIWVHIANVPESPPLLEVIRRLLAENGTANCLVTTTDKELPQSVANRLPERVIHEAIPTDSVRDSMAFLRHWHPDLVVWSDFVLRPALLDCTKRTGIPVVLVNARLSVVSFRRWRFLRGMVGSLLGRFDKVLVQDDSSAGYFRALGVPKNRITVAGALKEGSSPLPYNEGEYRTMATAVNGRTVWLAAGLHDAELPDILATFLEVRRSFPELLLIIAPANPEAGGGMVKGCREKGFNVAQRTAGDSITKRTEVYIADTRGDMGLWFRLAPVSFLGGSLVTEGGYNPFEAAALGSAILHGPNISDYASAYHKLTSAGACVEIADGAALTLALRQTLVPERAAELATAAWAAGSEGAEVTDMVLDVLRPYLNRKIS